MNWTVWNHRTAEDCPRILSRMPRRLAATVLAGVLAATGAPAALLVDFNSTSQDGGPHPQAGYESYDAAHEVASDFVTSNYTAFGATITLTPDWPATTDNRVQQMIDRGAGNDANWVGDKIDLLTDWIGIDARTGSGGNGDWDRASGTNITYITLTVGGLPANDYRWYSYHHDTENVWADYQVEVSTDGGATWSAPVDGQGTDSTGGGAPASPQTYTGTPDPNPRNLPSTFVWDFEADGANPVVFRYAPFQDPADPTGVHKQLFAINGIEIYSPQDPPVIEGQPADVQGTLGAPATLGGTVLGAGVAFQWEKDGTPIPDATNSTYVIENATASDAGSYALVATNPGGSVTTDAATVTIGLPPVEPASQVVLNTFPATFSITMPTNATYTFAWSGPGGPIADATNDSVTVESVTPAEAGTYTVDVTYAGETLSAMGTLIVPPAPTASYPDTVIADSPVGYWRLGEPPAAFTVQDEVSPFYDFNVGLNTVLGSPGAVLGDSNTAASFDGTADSALVGQFDQTELNPAIFSVEFWARPTGGSGRRAVVGSRDVWVDPSHVEGYEIGLNASGQWEFRTGQGDLSVSGDNAWNTVTGPAATLGAWSHVVGTYDGATMELYVNGASVGSLAAPTFVPQTIWETRFGASANEVPTAGDVFVGDLDEIAIYDAALSAADVLDHYTAAFSITASPVISAQPQTQAVLINSQAVFQVSVLSGTNPSYQWRRGGVDIPGATDATYLIDPVELDSAGEYDVVVNNNAGSTTSDAAFLVPLQDLIGTFILPDETNTVLVRDGSSNWFSIENQGAADAAGQWNRREIFGILPDFTPWGWQSGQAGEDNGDVAVRTTITGLQPNTAYAVWSFYSDKATGRLSDLLSGFDGEELTRFTPANGTDTGLIATSEADPWPVYNCFLGIRTSSGSGTLAVVNDYAEGAGRSVYHGVGYQLAVPAAAPPVISIPPTGQSVLLGDDATFTVAASSIVPLTYQWQFNQVDIPDATNATLSIPGVAASDAGRYRVVVENSEGIVTSPEAVLVAYPDYLQVFVPADETNTVLTRNNSADWFTDTQGDAETNGLWWARAEFAIPGVTTNGFYANGAIEAAGNAELRTTLDGLTPGEEYALWIVYSFPPAGTGSRIAGAIEGRSPTTWDDGLGANTGLINGPGNGHTVYQGFLGVATASGGGTVAAVIDYRGLGESIYNGLVVQPAILPPETAIDIQLQAGEVVLDWPSGEGTLQQSTDLTDPDAWTDVPDATPPYTDPGDAPNKAFRLRE